MPDGKDPITISTHARRGFSLVELVVVIIIMAILGAIAVPRFAHANTSHRADAAAQLIANALREAALDARMRSDPVRVQFNPATERFQSRVNRTLEILADFSIAVLNIDGLGDFDQSAAITLSVAGVVRAVMVDAASGSITSGTAAQGQVFTDAEGLN